MSNPPPPMLQYKSPTDRIMTKERANAGRSLRALGGLCIGIGALIAFSGVMISSTAVGGGISMAMAIYLGSIALSILGLGVTYWICAIKIIQFSTRAATVAMAVVGVHVALICLSVVGSIQTGGTRGGIVSILPLLFIPGLVQLLVYLAKLRREVT